MMRYAEVPWPWAGLTIALLLLAQESLLKFFGDSASLALTSWRILVMTIGVTSLALIILPPRRPAYLLGALTCAGLMAWALWLQYGLGLDPSGRGLDPDACAVRLQRDARCAHPEGCGESESGPRHEAAPARRPRCLFHRFLPLLHLLCGIRRSMPETVSSGPQRPEMTPRFA